VKKYIILFFLTLFVFSSAACEKEEQTYDQSGEIEESAKQEYSGAIYTVRTEYEDGTYALRDYREDGIIFAERLYDGNFLKSESFYGFDGQLEQQINYRQNGDVLTDTLYTVNGREVIAKGYDKNGAYTGKTVTSLNINDLVESVVVYNKDGVLNEEYFYGYDSQLRCIREESVSYENNIACVTVIQTLDPENGEVLLEETVQYTPFGAFVLHEVYEYRDDDIILVEKYDVNGNSLPIEQ